MNSETIHQLIIEFNPAPNALRESPSLLEEIGMDILNRFLRCPSGGSVEKIDPMTGAPYGQPWICGRSDGNEDRVGFPKEYTTNERTI